LSAALIQQECREPFVEEGHMLMCHWDACFSAYRDCCNSLCPSMQFTFPTVSVLMSPNTNYTASHHRNCCDFFYTCFSCFGLFWFMWKWIYRVYCLGIFSIYGLQQFRFYAFIHLFIISEIQQSGYTTYHQNINNHKPQ
jgi:hypothetical protein